MQTYKLRHVDHGNYNGGTGSGLADHELGEESISWSIDD